MANPKHSVQVGPRGVIVKGIFVLTIILLLVKSSFVQRYSTYIYANHPALLFDGETTDETSINMRELTFTDFGWDYPNLTIACGYGQDKATGFFANAVVDHPRYNASESGSSSSDSGVNGYPNLWQNPLEEYEPLQCPRGE